MNNCKVCDDDGLNCNICGFDPGKSSASPACSTALIEYIVSRRKTIEASIAAERLAGNEHKEACERTALAELEALERRLPELVSR